MILGPISVEIVLDTGETAMVEDFMPLYGGNIDEMHEDFDNDADGVLSHMCETYTFATMEELSSSDPNMILFRGLDGRHTALRKKCMIGFTAYPPTTEQMIEALSNATVDEEDDE